MGYFIENLNKTPGIRFCGEFTPRRKVFHGKIPLNLSFSLNQKCLAKLIEGEQRM
jgi:hypothetical protein